MSLSAELERAKEQRYESLIHAFKIIDSFAVPSLPTEKFTAYEEIKTHLLTIYKPKNYG